MAQKTETPEKTEKNVLYCNFCGKSQHEVRKMIARPTVFICDECTELCMDICYEKGQIPSEYDRIGNLTPEKWHEEKAKKLTEQHVLDLDLKAFRTKLKETEQRLHNKTNAPDQNVSEIGHLAKQMLNITEKIQHVEAEIEVLKEKQREQEPQVANFSKKE